MSEIPIYAFEHTGISDPDVFARTFDQHKPDAVMYLAAESHVDRSIDGPAAQLNADEDRPFHGYAVPAGGYIKIRFHLRSVV